MATTAPPPETTFRDPETGRLLVLRGFGAMKGTLPIREGIDLTKPIFEQTLDKPKSRRR